MTFDGDPLDVMFNRSTDGGSTWGQPIRVNDDPEGNGAWQWFGTMSVAPNGRIDAVWNDTRADPTATFSELYYSFSVDGGLSWSANVPISPRFNHFLGYPNQRKLGDYYHMVSDNFGADLAYAATFNGEQDVYYLRIGANDCNGNGIENVLDIAGGTSRDCNTNGLPDECERDCNTNGTPDDCDVAAGTSADCNDNGVPDDCETDCNTNGVPDDCDVRDETSPDCNGDSIPDECQLSDNDCDSNGVPDECQITRIITAQPVGHGVCPLGIGAVSVEAQGAALTYQWRRNGVALLDGGDISGATTATLTIANFDAADVGRYTAMVADGCLATVSEGAMLTLLVPVSIIGQPEDLSERCAGFTAFFSVDATGSLLSYQWYKDGVPLMDGGRVTGSHTADMQIANITPGDNGTYTCVVADSCGGHEESTDCTLLVVDPAFTRQPTDTCAEPGGTARFTADATAPPPQTIGWRWKKNGVVISDGGHICGARTSVLTISDVTADDAGAYSALAFSSNPVCITDSESATLTIGDCPFCDTPGDMDGDGDYDLCDLASYTQCFGRQVTDSPECVCADLGDADGVIDLSDWIRLEALLQGPNR
jgi:hypothetical protein